eukprot:g4717.t1
MGKNRHSITLDNGLQVLVVEDKLMSRAAMAVAVGVGKFDSPAQFPDVTDVLSQMQYQGSAQFRELLKKFNGMKTFEFSIVKRYPEPLVTSASFTPEGLSKIAPAFADFFHSPNLTVYDAGDAADTVNSLLTTWLFGDPDFQFEELLLTQSADEKNPYSQLAYTSNYSFPEVKKLHDEYYCPKNMKLVILSPSNLNETESIAKQSFNFERECSGEVEVDKHVANELPEVGTAGTADTGTNPASACGAATQPAATKMYQPPAAVNRESKWAEAFPKEKMGKQFLTVASHQPEILILFPIRNVLELHRKYQYGVETYLQAVFTDHSPKSLVTVLQKRDLIHGGKSIQGDPVPALRLRMLLSKAGSVVTLRLMLTEKADKSPAELWKTLFQFFDQLREQSRTDLGKYIETIKARNDAWFKLKAAGFKNPPPECGCWDLQEQVAMNLARSLMTHPPHEVVSAPHELIRSETSDSVCLLKAVLESFTAQNMNFVHATKQAVPSETKILPTWNVRYVEKEDHPTGDLAAGEAAAVSTDLPTPLKFIPSLEQSLVPVLDQKDVPQHISNLDLYYYTQQPGLETPKVRLGFQLKAVQGAADSTSSCAHLSLRCNMLTEIHSKVVARILKILMNDFEFAGYTYKFESSTSGMTFSFSGYLAHILEVMHLVAGVAIDPLHSTGTLSIFQEAAEVEVRRIFSQVVKTIVLELEDAPVYAEHCALESLQFLLSQSTFSRREKLGFLKSRMGERSSPSDGPHSELKTAGRVKRDDLPDVPTNDLWDDFTRYISEQKERLLRMSAVSAGNLHWQTAQMLTQKMRDLLGNGVSLYGDQTQSISTIQSSPALIVQDRLLRLDGETGRKTTGFELRLENPIPGNSDSVTWIMWQLSPKSIEDEALLQLLAPVVHDGTVDFFQHTLDYFQGRVLGKIEEVGGKYVRRTYVVQDYKSPDEV